MSIFIPTSYYHNFKELLILEFVDGIVKFWTHLPVSAASHFITLGYVGELPVETHYILILRITFLVKPVGTTALGG